MPSGNVQNTIIIIQIYGYLQCYTCVESDQSTDIKKQDNETRGNQGVIHKAKCESLTKLKHIAKIGIWEKNSVSLFYMQLSINEGW